MTGTLVPPASGARPAAGPGLADTVRAALADRRVAFAAVVALGAVAGLLLATVIPRGPTTTLAGLGAIFLALVVGLASGLLLRSTWALIPAGLAQLLVFEVARSGLDGPTVDAIRLDSTFGIIALLVGRGLHALLVLVPLVVGARVLRGAA